MYSKLLAGRGPLLRAVLMGLALMVCAVVSPRAAADSGRDSTSQTGWLMYYGQTASDAATTAGSGYRLVSLRVANPSTPTFDTTWVSNSGPYAQAWWWYYGATATEVTNFLAANNARLIDVVSYDAGGGNRRFAVVMVSNTGANAKTWYWYYDATTTFLSTQAAAANARITHLSSDPISGNYHPILIANTGADADSWSWGFNASTSFLNTQLNAGQRLISLEVANPSGPTFNFVTEGSHGQRWWWFYGVATADLINLANQYGARLFDADRYVVGGTTYWALLMLDDSNALTDRIGDILRAGTDGVSGAYLKQINGPVLADLQSGYVFEPASMIKTLFHVHTLLRVQAGALSLATSHTVYSGYSGSCPLDTGPFAEPFQTTLNLMMVNSDNARAQSVRAYFGQAALNATAASLGLTNTLDENRMGCGADPPGDFGAVSHPNHLTLVDLGLIYEQVSNGILNPTYKADFYNLMDHSMHSDVAAILTQEAAGLGVSAARTSAFQSMVSEAYKGGSYGLSNGGPLWYDQTRGGWIKIPHRSGCNTIYYEYTYGTFVNNATNNTNASNAAETAFAELTREQLRAGLATYACIADFNNSGTVTVQDIFDFLAAWFAGLSCADINGVGGVTVQDIFDFLAAWFAGCP